MQRRSYGENVQREQNFVQGRNGRDGATERQVRQTRQIQPGNTFWRTIRPANPPLISS